MILCDYNVFIDKKFHRLTIISIEGRNNNYRVLVKCKCSCTNKTIKIVNLNSLKNGNTKSCGCLQKDIAKNTAKEKFTKHGMSNTQFYSIWEGIKKRCNNNKSSRYKDYGGRGIKCEWNSFEEFYEDMYQSYVFAKKKYRKVLSKNNPISIERKNVNGNYCKENCCWIPLDQQWKNTRHPKWFEGISPEGKKYTSNNQKMFVKIYNLNPSCQNDCLRGRSKTHKGWTFRYLTKKEVDEKETN